MKRLSLIKLMTLMFIMSAVAAHAEMSSGMALGVKGGLDMAKGTGFSASALTEAGAASSRTGFMGGASLELNVSDAFYIQPELLYNSKGTVLAGGTVVLADTQKLTYLTIPVLAKYKWSFDGGWKVAALAGPEFGYLLSACATPTGGTTCTNDKTSFKKVDIDLDIGVSGEYVINPSWSAVLDVRYSFGLTNVLNFADTTATAKNSGIQLMAGVQFAL